MKPLAVSLRERFVTTSRPVSLSILRRGRLQPPPFYIIYADLKTHPVCIFSSCPVSFELFILGNGTIRTA